MRAAVVAAWLAAAALAAGCRDARATWSPQEPAPRILAERGFSVAADLTSSDGAAPRGPLSSLQLRGNVGTLVHRGRPLEALVAEQIPYGLHRVAMVVAPAGDDLVVVFAYCDQGRLVRLYQESFAGGGFQELINPGVCRFERRPATATVRLRRLLRGPAATVPATVIGDRFALDGGRGHLELDGARWEAQAFHVVDCREGCGGPGWRELHLVAGRDGATALGIGYSFATVAGRIKLDHLLRLDQPALELPSRWYEATWAPAPEELRP